MSTTIHSTAYHSDLKRGMDIILVADIRRTIEQKTPLLRTVLAACKVLLKPLSHTVHYALSVTRQPLSGLDSQSHAQSLIDP